MIKQHWKINVASKIILAAQNYITRVMIQLFLITGRSCSLLINCERFVKNVDKSLELQKIIFEMIPPVREIFLAIIKDYIFAEPFCWNLIWRQNHFSRSTAAKISLTIFIIIGRFVMHLRWLINLWWPKMGSVKATNDLSLAADNAHSEVKGVRQGWPTRSGRLTPSSTSSFTFNIGFKLVGSIRNRDHGYPPASSFS